MFPFFNNPGSLVSPHQTSGFNPTPAQSLQQWQAQNTHLQTLQRAAMMHPMANLASSVFANNVIAPGDPQTARDWMQNTQAGQVTQQIASMMAGSGMLGLGRSGDMLYGIQNMVANSGMQLGVQGMPGASQFYGAGFLTDQMSLQIMGRMTQDFYSMGRNTFESRGLNMSDVGGIMNAAAARGVFSGKRFFEMESYTDATIQEDLQAAMSRGDTAMVEALKQAQPGQARMRLNDQSDQIKTFVQDTGDLLGDLRDLYGKLPIEELLQRAESITGMGVQEMGGPQAVRSRISRLTSMAGAYGLNPQAVLEANAQINQSISGQMSSMYGMSPEMYRRTSAALGASATTTMIGARQGMMESANVLGEHGVYVRQFSDDYIGAVAGQGSIAVMQQEYGAVEALYAADQASTSPENRAKLRGAVAKLQSATTVEEREQARAEIDAALRGSGFGGAGDQLARYGGDITRMTERMSAGALNDLANMTSAVDRRSALEYQVSDAMSTGMIKERFGVGDNAEGIFRSLIDNFDTKTLDDIMGATTRGGRKQRMIAAGMDPAEAARLAAAFDGPGMEAAFNAFQGEFRSNPMNANFQSQQTIRNAEARAYQIEAINNSLGRNRLSKPSLLQVGMAALGGYGDGPTEANILAYLQQEGSGMTIGRNADGGLDLMNSPVTADEMLLKMTGGDPAERRAIFDAMGVDSMEGFVKAVSSKEGFQKFHKHVMGNSRLYGALNGKNFFVAGADEVKEGAARMDAMASTALFEALGLGSVSDEVKMRIREGDAGELATRLMNDDMTKFNDKGKALMEKFFSGDEGAAGALKYFGKFSGQTDVILEGLDERQNELMKKRKKASGEEKTNIDEELQRIRQMKQDLGGEGGSEYVGTMRVILDNEAVIENINKLS